MISTGDIKKALDLPVGRVLNSRDVNIGARKVESLYSQQGYILAKVADVRMQPDGRLIVQVAEGSSKISGSRAIPRPRTGSSSGKCG